MNTIRIWISVALGMFARGFIEEGIYPYVTYGPEAGALSEN